jgi:hypothetical protein
MIRLTHVTPMMVYPINRSGPFKFDLTFASGNETFHINGVDTDTLLEQHAFQVLVVESLACRYVPCDAVTEDARKRRVLETDWTWKDYVLSFLSDEPVRYVDAEEEDATPEPDPKPAISKTADLDLHPGGAVWLGVGEVSYVYDATKLAVLMGATKSGVVTASTLARFERAVFDAFKTAFPNAEIDVHVGDPDDTRVWLTGSEEPDLHIEREADELFERVLARREWDTTPSFIE